MPAPATAAEIKALIERSHTQAKASGFWQEPIDLALKVVLIHSEISEALEEYRMKIEDRGGPLSAVLYQMGPQFARMTTERRAELLAQREPQFGHNALAGQKPVGFVIELADAAIRIFDLLGHLGRDVSMDNVAGVVNAAMQAEPGPIDQVSVGGMLAIAHMALAAASAEIGVGVKGAPRPDHAAAVSMLAGSLKVIDSLAQKIGGDLWQAIEIKAAYNTTRGHLHGKTC